jgi:hypothetical protein
MLLSFGSCPEGTLEELLSFILCPLACDCDAVILGLSQVSESG